MIVTTSILDLLKNEFVGKPIIATSSFVTFVRRHFICSDIYLSWNQTSHKVKCVFDSSSRFVWSFNLDDYFGVQSPNAKYMYNIGGFLKQKLVGNWVKDSKSNWQSISNIYYQPSVSNAAKLEIQLEFTNLDNINLLDDEKFELSDTAPAVLIQPSQQAIAQPNLPFGNANTIVVNPPSVLNASTIVYDKLPQINHTISDECGKCKKYLAVADTECYRCGWKR